jgi:hypothetical protein
MPGLDGAVASRERKADYDPNGCFPRLWVGVGVPNEEQFHGPGLSCPGEVEVEAGAKAVLVAERNVTETDAGVPERSSGFDGRDGETPGCVWGGTFCRHILGSKPEFALKVGCLELDEVGLIQVILKREGEDQGDHDEEADREGQQFTEAKEERRTHGGRRLTSGISGERSESAACRG